jgi:alkylhydroperoxidase/carboxymuconolactone decarboxylase family protein YurZ
MGITLHGRTVRGTLASETTCHARATRPWVALRALPLAVRRCIVEGDDDEEMSGMRTETHAAAMTSVPTGVSRAFEVFGSQAGGHAAAWMDATRALSEASALDPKTADLAYLAVLAALRLESGVPFHVRQAKEHGASRDEVISAVLLGLQPAGHGVTACLPAAVDANDAG